MVNRKGIGQVLIQEVIRNHEVVWECTESKVLNISRYQYISQLSYLILRYPIQYVPYNVSTDNANITYIFLIHLILRSILLMSDTIKHRLIMMPVPRF